AEERAEAVPVEAPPPREPSPAEPPKHPSEAPPAAETSAPEPPRTEDEPAERPIESLDTVEHPFEGAIEDTGEAEVVEGELEEGRELEGEEEGEGEDEDVLEETPEFLRDAPEDDELWFEQGEPRDFDF
ncbi:MAG TPA: hypothetical protein VFT14_02205, partial [Solirubrobacterales bacterium]|nr:hypothetical protein [Solirubrobacterales bacterium]